MVATQITTIDQRLAQIAEGVDSLGNGAIDLASVSAALNEFDAVWDELIPKEREHLIRFIIERVACSPDNDVRVVFRASLVDSHVHPRSVD